jgi:hypothetical protein
MGDEDAARAGDRRTREAPPRGRRHVDHRLRDAGEALDPRESGALTDTSDDHESCSSPPPDQHGADLGELAGGALAAVGLDVDGEELARGQRTSQQIGGGQQHGRAMLLRRPDRLQGACSRAATAACPPGAPVSPASRLRPVTETASTKVGG